MARLRQAIDEATRTLTGAGVPSARADAEELAAHAAGTSRGRLPVLDAVPDGFFARYDELVTARARRIPLQHLTGTTAFGPVTLEVGPGVFVPRPETEALLEWAVARQLPPDPVIVDLCTGSGALAAALAHQMPSARIVGVDISADALSYARRNAPSVELRQGDVRDPGLFDDLDGRVDLLVANPPYLPESVALEPEVAEHDPPEALCGGPDGTGIIAAVAVLAERWLKPGAFLAIEHDDGASDSVMRMIKCSNVFDDVTAHPDLGGVLRFVTARKKLRQ
ncbi:MAG: peptide chain release factor N(5)-glutamine methyltransferase [Candidatus Sericytochromatia bacterium]